MPSLPSDRTERPRPNHGSWHTVPPDEAARRLGVRRIEGLSTDEAQAGAAEYWPNGLEEKAGRSVWAILWEQVSSVIIVILMVAGVLALLFKGGDWLPLDAIAILAILVLSSYSACCRNTARGARLPPSSRRPRGR
jgi:Ca2+-transporting ATPase